MYKYIFNDIEIVYGITANNIHIVSSYQITKESDMISILDYIRREASKRGFIYRRTLKSWVDEWKAHNFLYIHNIAVDRTKSVDLNEDESTFKKLCYSLLSLCYKQK